MQPKEVCELLGIGRERIKYFKKQEVFAPENETSGNRAREYTDHDVDKLRQLIILTKAGLTCGDIKKIQAGEWTLNKAIINRQQIIHEEMSRMLGSLELSNLILRDNTQFDSMPTDYYWHEIARREQAGEEFMDEYENTHPISLIRTVVCPACGAQLAVDLEDYLWDETVNDDDFDNGMGPSMVFSFDSKDAFFCEDCGKTIRVSGWVREYPIGAYDSEDISVELQEEDNE